MDYTTIPRALIYKDRRWLDDFGVYKQHLINKAVVEKMKKYLGDFCQEKHILTCYNNAYHICTMVLLENDPVLRLNEYCKEAREYQHGIVASPTMTFVYYYLCLLPKGVGHHLKNFLKELRNRVQIVDERLLEELPNLELPSNEFAPRVIDESAVHDVEKSGFSWKVISDFYENEYLCKVIETLGKNIPEKLQLIEMFKTAIKNDYSDGSIFKEEKFEYLEKLRNEIAPDKEEIEHEASSNDNDTSVLRARIAELEKEVGDLKNKLSVADNADIEEIFPDQSSQNITSDINVEKLSDALKKIEEQEETIKDLNEIITKYQMRGLPPAKRKGIALGLTPLQADIFGDYLADKLDIVFNNKKEELSLILNCLFGQGRSSLANKMHMTTGAVDDRLYVASIFGPSAPKIAKEICSDWDEDTLAPWEEEFEYDDENTEEDD